MDALADRQSLALWPGFPQGPAPGYGRSLRSLAFGIVDYYCVQSSRCNWVRCREAFGQGVIFGVLHLQHFADLD